MKSPPRGNFSQLKGFSVIFGFQSTALIRAKLSCINKKAFGCFCASPRLQAFLLRLLLVRDLRRAIVYGFQSNCLCYLAWKLLLKANVP